MAWVLPLVLAIEMAAQSGTISRRLEMARELKQRGAPAEAAKAYTEVLPDLRTAGNRPLLAAALLEAGQASLAAGDYTAALVRGNEAATLFQALQDVPDEALAFNLTGSAEVYLGEYTAAIAQYQRALDLDRRGHDAQGEINRLNNISGAYFFLGRYLDALDGYQTVLQRADANANQAWGANRRQMALTNLAVLYEQLGQNQKAMEYYRQALAGTSALQPSEHAQLLSNAGTLYRRLGDAVKALEAYRQAQKLFAQEHLSDAEIHVLQNVGIALALDMQDARGAEEAFTSALVKSEATGNRRETVLAHLFRGEAYLRAARWSAAKTDLAAALDGSRAIGSSEEEWTALYGMARVQRQEGKSGEALTTLREAIGVIEAVRTGLGASSLKAEFLANKRDVYDAAIGLTLDGGKVEAETLFHLFEQARARNLRDALGGEGGAVSLRAVQARLGERLLIEYWLGDGKLAQIRVSKNEWGYFSRLWRAEDDARLQSLLVLMQSGADGWREQAGRLGQGLLGKAPRLTEAKEVIVVPDGGLYEVPFEALVTPPGERPLIEKVAVSYLPSAALLTRAVPAATYRPPWLRQWVGFGNPLLAARAVLPGDEQWARLPQSERELESIARALPGRATIHGGAQDLKRFLFTAETRGTPLLHFATHAIADTADPNRSRMLFTQELGDRGSEYLFRTEVEGLRLKDADLVTLSACDTEAGKVVRGEGVQSFSRSFLAAGARSTVTTLWRVEDRATADFMQTFYQHLAKGEGKAEALRRTKLSFLKEAGPRSHPQYWAAFVLNGDGQSPIRPVFRWAWVAAVTVGTVGLLTASYRYRRHFHRRLKR